MNKKIGFILFGISALFLLFACSNSTIIDKNKFLILYDASMETLHTIEEEPYRTIAEEYLQKSRQEKEYVYEIKLRIREEVKKLGLDGEEYESIIDDMVEIEKLYCKDFADRGTEEIENAGYDFLTEYIIKQAEELKISPEEYIEKQYRLCCELEAYDTIYYQYFLNNIYTDYQPVTEEDYAHLVEEYGEKGAKEILEEREMEQYNKYCEYLDELMKSTKG